MDPSPRFSAAEALFAHEAHPAAAAEAHTGRGRLVLGVSMAVLAAVSAVVWSAYHQGVRVGGREGAPVIQAAEGHFKTTPLDPGGAQTPHLEARVFDRLERGAPPRATATDRAAGLAPEAQAAGPEDAGQSPMPSDGRAAIGADAPATLDDPQAAVTAPPMPAPRSLRPDRAEGLAPAATALGPYAVQLGSFRSRRGAELAWEMLLREAGDLFTDRQHALEETDLGERGVYHRVYVLDFDSAPRAAAFCAEVTARGHGCLVTRR